MKGRIWSFSGVDMFIGVLGPGYGGSLFDDSFPFIFGCREGIVVYI